MSTEIDTDRTVLHQALFGMPKLLARFDIIDVNRGVKAIDLAWPRSVSGLARYSIRTVDLLMVGWAVGAVGISALAFGFTIYKILKRFAVGFSSGTLSLVSQYHGNDDHEGVAFVLKQSVWLGILFSIPLALGTFVLADDLIAFLGADPEVVEKGAAYLRLMAIGFIFQFFSIICSRAFAGVGDTRTPMIVRSGSAILNIFLNGVLIFGLGPFPALGVVGAGLATVIAVLVAAVWFVWLILRREDDLMFVFGSKQWDNSVVRSLLKIGFPSTGRKLVNTAARLPLLAILAMFGTGVIAAYEVGRRVLELAQTPMWGLEFAASVLVGQELGDGNFVLASDYARDITRLSLAFLTPIFVIVGLIPEHLGWLFVQDPETLGLVAFFLRVYAVAGIGYTLDEALTGVLTGAGDTQWPFYGTLLGLYGVMLPIAYVGGVMLEFGLIAIALSFLAEFYVPALVNMYRVQFTDWQTRLSD